MGQVEAMKIGIGLVVPPMILQFYTWHDLRDTIMDVDKKFHDLKKCVRYINCGQGMPHIKSFWSAVEELTPLERQYFIFFIAGTKLIPKNSVFIIKNGTNKIEAVPEDRIILLPKLTKSLMYEQLIEAIINSNFNLS